MAEPPAESYWKSAARPVSPPHHSLTTSAVAAVAVAAATQPAQATLYQH